MTDYVLYMQVALKIIMRLEIRCFFADRFFFGDRSRIKSYKNIKPLINYVGKNFGLDTALDYLCCYSY